MMDTMNLTPKRLLLIDSAGGLLSAFLLGVVLAGNETTFGMPQHVLYFLACLAFVFAVYSFLCHWQIKGNRNPYLKAIAIANLLYCCLTISLLVYHRRVLTGWGLSYFLLEVGVILCLVIMELKTVSASAEKQI